ncbi:MAG: 16S rRNA (cytidine(1402)-2'-O)-methyltransferase [Methylophilaceae bacterium]
MIPALYLVATPIGNLEDITYRAIGVLKNVDLIACEDTRHTSHLLSHFGIKKKLTSLHQHNEKYKTDKLLKELEGGVSIAYVSDAGTPAISDPGAHLVNKALKQGFKVIPVPGASSVISAFSVSGVESTQFEFHGFLPNSESKSKKLLNEMSLKRIPAIFFVSPHRILKTIEILEVIYGSSHEVFIARELTKIYETLYKDELQNILKQFRQDKDNLKGEFVVIVEPMLMSDKDFEGLPLKEALKVMMKELTLNQSVKLATTIFKKSKKDVYNLALELKK